MQKAILFYFVDMLVFMLLFCGCGRPAANPAAAIAPVSGSKQIIGNSVHSRPIEAITIGHGKVPILIMATIHGNEWVGTPLLEKLRHHLTNHPETHAGRRVVLIPLANPDGYALKRRTNANGVDLNRNFPALNRIEYPDDEPSALPEPETQALMALIDKLRPAYIISIHQPLGCIDYDGPAADLAQFLADSCDLPVRKLGAYPGSMGAYYGEDLNIPIITLELRRGDYTLSDDELWRRYGPCLLAAFDYDESLVR